MWTLYKNYLMAVAGFLTGQLLKEKGHLCLDRQTSIHLSMGSTIPAKQYIHAQLQKGQKTPTVLPCPLSNCLSQHMQAGVPG